ncbi:MAG: hypothetical protein GF401_04965 [Chitinivibrionales bacterium]|nr:hypothetical protein [Chitinivibrionales bacterium]
MKSLIFFPFLFSFVLCYDTGDSMNSYLTSEHSNTSLPAIDVAIPENLQTATFALG